MDRSIAVSFILFLFDCLFQSILRDRLDTRYWSDSYNIPQNSALMTAPRPPHDIYLVSSRLISLLPLSSPSSLRFGRCFSSFTLNRCSIFIITITMSRLLHPLSPHPVDLDPTSSTHPFLTAPFFSPLLFPNLSSDARDHCANERTFLSWLRLSVYMAIVSVAIMISFHLKNEPTHIEKQLALPVGLLFWVLSFACLANGFANYVKTVTKYGRRRALVQSGWKTQIVSRCFRLLLCRLRTGTGARASEEKNLAWIAQLLISRRSLQSFRVRSSPFVSFFCPPMRNRDDERIGSIPSPTSLCHPAPNSLLSGR